MNGTGDTCETAAAGGGRSRLRPAETAVMTVARHRRRHRLAAARMTSCT